MVLKDFRKRFLGKRPALFKLGQWHFQQDNTPVNTSILVTHYLTKMSIKTVTHRPYSPDLAPCDFWLLLKLRSCCYEKIEEMKEAVTKVIDTLTQVDFHGAIQKLLERYNKCIAAGGDYVEGDLSFMSVLSIKVPIRKKSSNLFNDPRTNNFHRTIWLQAFLSITNKFHRTIWFQVLLSYTNNFYRKIWFHLFLFDTNNYHRTMWFQVLLSNTNNFHRTILFQVFLYNTNNFHRTI